MSGLFAHWNSEKLSGPTIGLSGNSMEKSVVINKDSDPDFFPNPTDFQILKYHQIGKYLIVSLKYPKCINYEGTKILVFFNCTMKQLQSQSFIDPHFIDNTKYYSPIARFIPTEDGWLMAELFCNTMNSINK